MATPELFPLRLTPFEELFVHEHRPPRWPARIGYWLTFSGQFDPAIARQALDIASSHQPLARCVLEFDHRQRLHWKIGSQSPEIVFSTVPSDEQLRIESWKPMDLFKQGPLRIQIVQGPTSVLAYLEFHHAAFDGIGAFQVTSDWLAAYHAIVHGESPDDAIPVRKPVALRLRSRPSLTLRQRIRLAPQQWRSVIGAINFFRNVPMPLRNSSHQDPIVEAKVHDPPPTPLTESLGQSATKKLKERAVTDGVTVNDLVVAAMFGVIKKWHGKNSDNPQGTHIRLTVPINERTKLHRRMPGCNHCTMISIDRRFDQLSQVELVDGELVDGELVDGELVDGELVDGELVDWVHEEIEHVRKWRLSLSFWTFLGLARRLPGGLQKRSKSDRCESTCLLTNLGNILPRLKIPRKNGKLIAGSLTLEAIQLMAPIRSGTSMAVVIFQYQDQLHFTLHHDRDVLSVEEARSLLKALTNRLQAQ